MKKFKRITNKKLNKYFKTKSYKKLEKQIIKYFNTNKSGSKNIFKDVVKKSDFRTALSKKLNSFKKFKKYYNNIHSDFLNSFNGFLISLGLVESDLSSKEIYENMKKYGFNSLNEMYHISIEIIISISYTKETSEKLMKKYDDVLNTVIKN